MGALRASGYGLVLLTVWGCAEPPPGRPLYTPIPESLQHQTLQTPAFRPQVQTEVTLWTAGMESDAWVFVSPVNTVASETRVAEGQERTATVRVQPYDPTRRGYPYELRLEIGDELLLADRGVVPAGQTVRVEGDQDLVLEMVIRPL